MYDRRKIVEDGEGKYKIYLESAKKEWHTVIIFFDGTMYFSSFYEESYTKKSEELKNAQLDCLSGTKERFYFETEKH